LVRCTATFFDETDRFVGEPKFTGQIHHALQYFLNALHAILVIVVKFIPQNQMSIE